MASIWTWAGIPAPTVGLVLGTGRGGIAASQAAAGEGSSLAAGGGEGVGVAAGVASGGEGAAVGCSHAAESAKAERPTTSRIVRCIERSDTTDYGVRSLFTALRSVRTACVAGLVALSALRGAGDARAEEPSHTTTKLECAHASEPGRVRCEVEVRVPAGSIIKWGDVVVTSVPVFASALRARVGPLEATAHEDTVWRWPLALAARARGTGELAVRARIVSCVKEACTPSELEARTTVAVGE
jgi:hypothetical protein